MARRSKRDEPSGRPEGDRFEATVHPGEHDVALSQVSDLDLDRIPDPQGGVRVVVTADELAELVRRGFEVRVYPHHPARAAEPRPGAVG